MSTQYQSGKDVPTEILVARLNELAHVVARKRDRIGDEFTMRIPAECDRDADLVMSEAARRLSAAPAVQSKPTRHKKPMSYPNGLDMESMPGLVEMRVDGKESVIDSPSTPSPSNASKGRTMILATSSGWLISVDKMSETAHTVTVQERGAVEAPFTISKSDPDQRLFDNTAEASAWIDDHPARKEPSHDNQ